MRLSEGFEDWIGVQQARLGVSWAQVTVRGEFGGSEARVRVLIGVRARKRTFVLHTARSQTTALTRRESRTVTRNINAAMQPVESQEKRRSI